MLPRGQARCGTIGGAAHRDVAEECPLAATSSTERSDSPPLIPICVNHPHRRSERKCARCARDFCAECLPDDQDLCDRCRQEEILADEIEARRSFTPRNILRWVTSGHTITSIVVFVLLLSIGLVPAFLTARSTAEEGIDPTVVRRVQVGLTQAG